MSDDGGTASPFVFGVASGDMSHRDVVLWAKLSAGPWIRSATA